MSDNYTGEGLRITTHPAQHKCSESLNPRRVGFCDCGLRLPERQGSTRDLVFEREMLELAVEGASRFYHARPVNFVQAVQGRLAYGAREYGEGSFLRSEIKPLEEAMVEAPDGVAWLFGWLYQQRPSLSEEEFRWLAQAAVPAMSAAAACWASLHELGKLLKDEVAE